MLMYFISFDSCCKIQAMQQTSLNNPQLTE